MEIFIRPIVSGAPNDSFLLNTLKTLFRLSRVLRSLKMHSKRHYKFLPVRSSQRNLSLLFSKLQGLQYCFPENYRYSSTYFD